MVRESKRAFLLKLLRKPVSERTLLKCWLRVRETQEHWFWCTKPSARVREKLNYQYYYYLQLLLKQYFECECLRGWEKILVAERRGRTSLHSLVCLLNRDWEPSDEHASQCTSRSSRSKFFGPFILVILAHLAAHSPYNYLIAVWVLTVFRKKRYESAKRDQKTQGTASCCFVLNSRVCEVCVLLPPNEKSVV